jgi:hypothetical protein
MKKRPQGSAKKQLTRVNRPPRRMEGRLPAGPSILWEAGNRAVSRWLRGGEPIDPGLRTAMEKAFGKDFQRVRIHRDGRSARQAERLNAAAFTSGEEIVLGRAAPAPQTAEGRKLLAHELAHVVQQKKGASPRGKVSGSAADAFEADAERAAAEAAAGRGVRVPARGPSPPVQRQGLDVGKATEQAAAQVAFGGSPVEIAVEAFLNREWEAQSKGEKPFRITPAVRKGLEIVFSTNPLGMAAVASDLQMDPGTPAALLDRIRDKLPKTLPASALDLLNKMPAPAEPKPEKIEGPKPKKSDEAYTAALKEALRRLLATEAGQQLARSAKKFALSKEGIPLVAIVVGGVVTFVAANDREVPSVPDIPLGEGVKLKIDYKGRFSDLPPLVRQMVGMAGERPATEVKVGIAVKVTNEKMMEFLRAAGRFFALVGRGIAKGLIVAGKAIATAAVAVWPYLGPALGGAALGALIGGLAGGWLGAGIGALIGAGVGLLGALTGKLIAWLKRRKKGR